MSVILGSGEHRYRVVENWAAPYVLVMTGALVAWAIRALSYFASLSSRLDMITSTIGAPSGRQITAMSLRVPQPSPLERRSMPCWVIPMLRSSVMACARRVPSRPPTERVRP